MEKIIRECFILAQLTHGLSLAIANQDEKAVKRLIASRQNCLDAIGVLRRQAGGRLSDEVEKRMRAIGDELVELERRNIADMRGLLGGLKTQERELHVSMRQLAQIKSGYVHVRESKSRPKVFNHYC